ncbi:MAG: bifunctional (p)ppGpp synthetase/guanosine-3',5'-bis(diphosphate) 3'-pyrophosphohydrolase [Oscillospiraceae bacterium]|jgi:GTP pyrophosphokinase|nr:bifunctional (p)ppGpp synthetase/guanosine-3',5'-bis(diphosphate) 3'-pyrophosphohydrolase [Oscillospiraceae bacterium]
MPEEVYDYDEYLERRYVAVMERLLQSDPLLDSQRLRAAFDFARLAHSGQVRKSGEPYVIHPVEVALIVAEMNLDSDSVVAALLHDTIEDTGYNYQNIKSRFGAAVADLVEGVTKLTRTEFSTKEEQQMENLRKMFLAMARDIRVILIKIADRLHNMRTSEYWSEQKRREKSLETMELYAPLAHRLGIQKIKWDLEDLALKNLDPIAYKEITQDLSEKEGQHTDFLSQVKGVIASRLEDAGIDASIEGRVKHIYSIYRKMYTQHKALFEIYDLYAVRVIVLTVADCYNVLGFIHDIFKPIPGRFKDYISTPKPNMYQSLHTTVIGREGMPFEVQIRTWDMHRTAEYGIAAHWEYKEGALGDKDLNRRLEWVRRLLETQQDTDAEEFIKAIKVDMFADEVFVFTPKGDVINLPVGANAIDFAYAIHSAVGNRMMGAKINGKMVNLEYHLQNGDIIEIITGNSHGPGRDWLKMVKTSEARNKIKQWFKKERYEENVAQGKSDFERELKRTGISMQTILQDDVLPPALKRMSLITIEDMYAAIGYGGLTVTRAINRFRDELVRLNKQARENPVISEKPKKQKKAISGVIVEGLDNCLIKFSRCCTPVPGDDIVGFITRGFGVSIHRSDCTNALQMQQTGEDGRWVEVQWAEDIKDTYMTDLTVTAQDRQALLIDIMAALSGARLPIRSLAAKSVENGVAVIKLTAEVTGREQLIHLRNDLSRVSGVMTVKRE